MFISIKIVLIVLMSWLMCQSMTNERIDWFRWVRRNWITVSSGQDRDHRRTSRARGSTTAYRNRSPVTCCWATVWQCAMWTLRTFTPTDPSIRICWTSRTEWVAAEDRPAPIRALRPFPKCSRWTRPIWRAIPATAPPITACLPSTRRCSSPIVSTAQAVCFRPEAEAEVAALAVPATSHYPGDRGPGFPVGRERGSLG